MDRVGQKGDENMKDTRGYSDKDLDEKVRAYRKLGYRISPADLIRDNGHTCVTGVIAVKGGFELLLGWYSEHYDARNIAVG